MRLARLSHSSGGTVYSIPWPGFHDFFAGAKPPKRETAPVWDRCRFLSVIVASDPTPEGAGRAIASRSALDDGRSRGRGLGAAGDGEASGGDEGENDDANGLHV